MVSVNRSRLLTEDHPDGVIRVWLERRPIEKAFAPNCVSYQTRNFITTPLWGKPATDSALCALDIGRNAFLQATSKDSLKPAETLVA